jgi:hypothetical protein
MNSEGQWKPSMHCDLVLQGSGKLLREDEVWSVCVPLALQLRDLESSLPLFLYPGSIWVDGLTYWRTPCFYAGDWNKAQAFPISQDNVFLAHSLAILENSHWEIWKVWVGPTSSGKWPAGATSQRADSEGTLSISDKTGHSPLVLTSSSQGGSTVLSS